MKIKQLFLLVVLLLVHHFANAQSQAKVPVSPEAAALTKMVNYPVNFNTGIPDISVPLYNVQAGNLSLPIKLSYHAGGFKIHERATRSGMGWSLSSDIQITRSVNGMDDLDQFGYIHNSKIKVYRVGEEYYRYPINIGNGLDCHKIAIGELDGMPDKFNYKLLNKSGSFYFRKDGSGEGYTIVPVPFDNIRVIFSDGEFTIVDNDGTSYYFGSKGAMHVDDRAAKGIEFTNNVKTTFKCVKIENANKTETINFTYETKSPLVFNISNQSIQYLTTDNLCNLNPFYRADQITSTYSSFESLTSAYPMFRLSSPKYIENMSNGQSVFHFPYLNSSNQVLEKTYPLQMPNFKTTVVYGVALSRIDFRTGAVEFNGAEQLNSIKIKDHNNQQIKGFDFFQSVVTNGNSADYNSNNINLFSTNYLDSVKCSGITNAAVETYKFVYGNKYAFGTQLQGKYAWGYPNILTQAISNSNGFTAIPETKISQMYFRTADDACHGYGTNATFTFGTANSLHMNSEMVDEVPLNAGMLRRLIYPTGGYVDFEFESNAARQSVGGQTDLYAMTGGLRIKTISYGDGKSWEPKSYKYYRYGETEDGTGLLMNTPYREYDVINRTFKPYKYSQKIAYIRGPGTTNMGIAGNPIPSNCSSKQCLSIPFVETRTSYVPASSVDYSYPNGAPIYYTKVTEYNSDLGQLTGKKVYNYYAPDAFQPYSFSSNQGYIEGTNVSILHSDGLMGVERSIEDYAFNRVNGNFKLVHSKEFTYSKYSKQDQIRVIFVYPAIEYAFLDRPTSLSDDALYDQNSTFSSGELGSPFYAGEYGIQVGKLLLTSETEKWFKDNDISEKYTSYAYQNDLYPQVSKIITAGVNGKRTSKTFKYAYDYPGVAVYDAMKNRNMTSQVIEEINATVSDNDEESESSRSRTEYALWHANFHILPAAVLKSVNGTALKTEITFDLYGDHENVWQLTEKGWLFKTYLWGYNDLYPVIEVKGANYYDVTAAFAYNSVDYNNDAQIKSTGNTISNALPNSMVSTFAYSPMIGVTRMTSADGNSKFFRYDDYGRLFTVKDDQGNILKKHDYALAPTSSIAGSLFTVNNPMMLTYNYVHNGDNLRRMANAYLTAGIYFNPSSSLGANNFAESNLNSNWSNNLLVADNPGPEASVKIRMNTWPSNAQVPGTVYLDLIQDNSIVVSKRIPYNTPTSNLEDLYIAPGQYKVGIRFAQNYNGSLSRLMLDSQVIKSGDVITLQPGSEHTVILFND
ncbi:hypothetical protein [Pedobacter terrae]|uniref:hypothetical protein n=1 Tax=Pedobacter terrae TaxID=405671 RepID=UPI002FFC7EC2